MRKRILTAAGLFVATLASALYAAEGGVTLCPTKVPCDSSPYVVCYSLSDLSPDTAYYFKIRIRVESKNLGQTYNPTSKTWLRQTSRWTDQPDLHTDIGGKAEGWVFFRTASDQVTAGQVQIVLRKKGTESNIDDLPGQVAVTVMPRTGFGWLTGHAFRDRSLSSPCAKHMALGFVDTTLVASFYTEENGLDEGISGAGGFVLTAPVGRLDSLVVVNQSGTRFRPYLKGPQGWTVVAGETLNVDLLTGVRESQSRILPSEETHRPGPNPARRQGLGVAASEMEIYDSSGRRVVSPTASRSGVYFIRSRSASIRRGYKVVVM